MTDRIPNCSGCGAPQKRKIEDIKKVPGILWDLSLTCHNIFFLDLPILSCTQCNEYEYEFTKLQSLIRRICLFDRYVCGYGDIYCVHLPEFGWSIHSCFENAKMALDKNLNTAYCNYNEILW